MSGTFSAEDPRVAAATNRIAAARAETMTMPDTPKRALTISLLDDLDRALAGDVIMTDAESEKLLTQLARGWSS